MDNWVFGCDICQQVCPWNQRFAKPDERLSGETRIENQELTAELSLSPEEFNRKFKGNPIKRAKRRGYLRNVAIALGNSGQASVVPVLVESLKVEPEPLVRRHAAWALGQIDDVQARRSLQKAAASEDEPGVLAEIQAALED